MSSLRHGHARDRATTRTYYSWQSMKRRCTDPGDADFAAYGGSGVTVCARWLLFDAFLADMGQRPIGMTLDRIHNDRGYELENCRWATRFTQRRNQRRSLTVEIVREIRDRSTAGETNRSIADRFGVDASTVSMIRNRKTWADIA